MTRQLKLQPTSNWTLLEEPLSVAQLALAIMRYRRQYKSKGIATFAKEWLEPMLDKITSDLDRRGYTVAVVVKGGDYGYKNYCFDLSKDGVKNNTLFVAHYDTVDSDVTPPYQRQQHYDPKAGMWVFEPSTTPEEQPIYKSVDVQDGIAFLTAGEAALCLGADDGAGLAVMLNLMSRGQLGGYCFTTGEECGGIGASEVVNQLPSFLKQYTHSVEIDRRGTDDIIIEQGVGKCASETFGNWLGLQLGMGHQSSLLGSYTDVATFAELIPENVNIAAGYINAHTSSESVDLVYLTDLADALIKVNWAEAPIEREAGDFGQSDNYFMDLDFSKEDLKILSALFSIDYNFMLYALELNIVTYADLNDLCIGYYGKDWEEVVEEFNRLNGGKVSYAECY